MDNLPAVYSQLAQNKLVATIAGQLSQLQDIIARVY